jgi:SAM-dependent methyltransferase
MLALRRHLDVLSGLVGKANARRTFTPPPGHVYVNLGSGIAVAPGWVNIDAGFTAMCAALPAPVLRLIYLVTTVRRSLDPEEFVRRLKSGLFIHADLRTRIPLPDECADVIYTAHFVEHLYRDEAERLFREAWRVLKPTGVFRINVPSLEVTLERFAQGKTEDALTEFFAHSAAEERRGHDRHRYMYDFSLLEGMLRHAGFSNVVRRSRGEGVLPDLELFEQRPTGLYAEATKTAPVPARTVL